MITETWLDSQFDNSSLLLNDFQIFRRDRAHGSDSHGGVMICIRKIYNVTQVSLQTEKELCFVNINLKRVSLKVGVAYRPPSMNSGESIVFFNIIRNFLENSQNYVLFGDFNLPGINWEELTALNATEKYFLDICNELNVHQVIREPTTEYGSRLDLCLCSDSEMVKNPEVREFFSSSDHAIITCEIYLNCQVRNEKTIFYNFNEADWEMARAHLALVNWDYYFHSCSDVYSVWNLFVRLIDEMLCLYVPTGSIRKNDLPWFNSKLKNMKKIKLRKWKKYQRSRSHRFLVEYRTYSNLYASELVKSRTKYEENKFYKKSHKPKQFFNFIRKSTETTDEVAPLLSEENIFYSDSEKCNILSRHYKKMFTVENDNLPYMDQCMPENSFTDFMITETDVVKAIQNMNANSGPGFDGIFPKFIKNLAPFLIKPLCKIFNMSLNSGKVPEDWISSIIIPIYKRNGKPSLSASYRPINLTSCVSKIFERILYGKIMEFLLENDLISKSQHGFLSKRSTVTNLLTCTFDWVSFFNEKQALDIIYIDYEKAFDKVPHKKLLYKMRKLGFGGKIMSWIESFITKRRQCVRVKDSYSQFESVDSGVAQGTLLGPLLFILYLSDVTKVIENSELILYADDSKIYHKTNTNDDCNKLAQDLRKLENWCNEWQLSINYEKCEVLRIGKNNLNCPYEMGECTIPSKNFCRDLGVFIGKDIYYRHHYEILSRNCHYFCRKLKYSFTSRNVDFLIFMYRTYVLPKLDYASCVWSPYFKKDVDLLENVQRKFTKFLPEMFNVPYLERLKILNLVTLEERRIFLDIILVYRMYHGLVDLDFHRYFSFNEMRTRGHSLKLNIARSRVNCHKYHFFNRIVKIWNSLPAKIVLIDKFKVFKVELFKYNVRDFCIGRAHT